MDRVKILTAAGIFVVLGLTVAIFARAEIMAEIDSFFGKNSMVQEAKAETQEKVAETGSVKNDSDADPKDSDTKETGPQVHEIKDSGGTGAAIDEPAKPKVKWIDPDKDDPGKMMWPIVPKYKPLVHDYYLCAKGNKTVAGFTHNNGKVRENHYVYLYSRGHMGFDITAKPGTKVYAAAGGKVSGIVFTKNNKSIEDYGNQISISHKGLDTGANVQTLYAHLSDVTVKSGQEVKKGELIGYSGSTGGSRIPHLHLEVKLDGANVDPLECLPEFDLKALKKKPAEKDGFPHSSVKLWNSINKNKWGFKVYVLANKEISSGGVFIPKGTELQLKSFSGGSAQVKYQEKTITVGSSEVLFTY